jgi:hypothetical protein
MVQHGDKYKRLQFRVDKGLIKILLILSKKSRNRRLSSESLTV